VKIYFAGSIRGGRDFAVDYELIVSRLGAFGEVLTEHVADQNLNDHGETLSDQAIFERDINWLREADLVIAEVSQPSLGVGYEIAAGLSLGKRIVCLFKPGSGSLSAMIGGNRNLPVIEYSGIDELFTKLDRLLAQ